MENNYQKILEKVRSNNSRLSTLAGFTTAFGIINIVASIIWLFAALGAAGKLGFVEFVFFGLGTSLLLSFGISLLFFASIGKAVNDIRIHTIARYKIEYHTEENEEKKEIPAETKDAEEKH